MNLVVKFLIGVLAAVVVPQGLAVSSDGKGQSDPQPQLPRGLSSISLVRPSGVDAFGCLSCGPLVRKVVAAPPPDVKKDDEDAKFRERMENALKRLPMYGFSRTYCIIGRNVVRPGDRFTVRLDKKAYTVAMTKIEDDQVFVNVDGTDFTLRPRGRPTLQVTSPAATPATVQKMQEDSKTYELDAQDPKDIQKRNKP